MVIMFQLKLRITTKNSKKVGKNLLAWILSPIKVKEFFENFWEKKPLYISRNNNEYYNELCSMNAFEKALSEKDMYFTKNIDVTSYIDGQRFTENLDGKATVSNIWDFFNEGKSIRLLNPQTFIPNVWLLNTNLQEFFNCFVGANMYLTPAGTQGFAPHYDDIEAFVLQLEGQKHWKVYNPRDSSEVLARESSKNFKEDEIGKPILKVTLKPGDMLYFPRGYIHQAKCLPDTHSLHLTVSCYQKNSWADLFEKIFPVALQKAIFEDVEFRKGLPIGYLNHMGMMFSEENNEFRQKFIQKFNELGRKVLEMCPIDAGVDQLSTNFIHDALPPCLTEDEKLYGGDRNVKLPDKNFLHILKNTSNTNLGVKLIRATSARLVCEEDEIYLYYTTDNSLSYHETEVNRCQISTSWAVAVEHLIRNYPNFVEMKDLPVNNNNNKVGNWKEITKFVYFLWQKGLILFNMPLRAIN
ncbi:conserved hypothetical protein [Pediculus humanus corporis]|uniref:Bifunctional lysine-specific demethylase and histidyl-hydroxylase n=1 Tax=Pediculus humanus subsp. corporis TaxID=121224 RepID=E0VDJ1_PEDHC|nr:uncharacterized protein Phum_PHUM117430 [Pediculus humanus corporis]EEB11447.1 conserved hypothetical protein [Pediculus humanus corporis]